jgi:hypothetical protein
MAARLEEITPGAGCRLLGALPRFDVARLFAVDLRCRGPWERCGRPVKTTGPRRIRQVIARPETSLNLLTDYGGRSERDVEPLEPADPHAAEQARQRAGRDAFGELLCGLDQTDRIILTQYFQDERTMKQIAAGLGLSESRVSQRMSQILARLRPAAERKYGLPPQPARTERQRGNLLRRTARGKPRRIA